VNFHFFVGHFCDILYGELFFRTIPEKVYDGIQMFLSDFPVKNFLAKEMPLEHFGEHHLADTQHAAPPRVGNKLLAENI